MEHEDEDFKAPEPKEPLEEEKGEAMEDINVNLDFIDPKEEYFHAIRHFLVNLLDGESYNVGDLADAIIAQVQVGTLVVNEDPNPEDRNVFAFASILPFALHSKRDSFKSIIKYCLSKASENLSGKELEFFKTTLETKKCALLVNERLMNLPGEPVPALHNVLKEDWEWALKQPVEGFDIEYLLYITKVATEIEEKPAKVGIKKKATETLSTRLYYKFEDEELEKNADKIITFNSKIGLQFAGATNPTEYTMKTNTTYQKMIMLIPFKKYLNSIPNFANILLSP